MHGKQNSEFIKALSFFSFPGQFNINFSHLVGQVLRSITFEVELIYWVSIAEKVELWIGIERLKLRRWELDTIRYQNETS